MDLNVQFYKMSKQMKTQLYLDNLTTVKFCSIRK